ncbi:S-adenosyl-L-methionine-dependent methyltransferase [Clavulina sp. PMI_390]|nr:S-adenosyl-L-methionine-dependent methyltransferase [Clavulina sp. PMI_390]
MSTLPDTMLYGSYDFDWEEYTASRPLYPKQLYDIIFQHHSKAGGKYSRALDVGCGPGTVTDVLASRLRGEIIGCDVNDKQLKVAQTRLAHHGPRIRFQKSTAEDLGWMGNHSADLVACAEAIHWIDAARFVSEAARVLRPNGTLAIWFYYPTVLMPSSTEVTAIHCHTLRANLQRTMTRNAGKPVVSYLKDTWRSELDNIAFPQNLWKNETRIRWNCQEDNWYRFDPSHAVERIDRRGFGSEGYVEKNVDDLSLELETARDSMSRSFTPAQFRQYVSSIDIVQDEDWPEMDHALAEIGRLLGPGERINVAWVAVMTLATRR